MGVRRKIATALAAGVTATTLVAWSCVMWSTATRTRDFSDGESIPEVVQDLIPPEWLGAQPPKVEYGVGEHLRGRPRPELNVWCAEHVGFGASSIRVSVDRPSLGGACKMGSDHNLVFISAGWPFKAMQGSVSYDGMPRINWGSSWSAQEGFTPVAMWLAPAWAQGIYTSGQVRQSLDVYLPLRIVPLGFVGNTLIFSTAALAVTLGIPQVRRWSRVRRGGCGVCGYSRAGLAIGVACPECGKGPA